MIKSESVINEIIYKNIGIFNVFLKKHLRILVKLNIED